MGGWDQVSVVSAGVNSVPEHGYGREVVSDSGVVLNVVEPPCHVYILLLLLDGQVHLAERGEGEVNTGISFIKYILLHAVAVTLHVLRQHVD